MKQEMEFIAGAIRAAVAEREALLQEMKEWYAAGNKERFPSYPALATLDERLSNLDTHYKLLWDAQRQMNNPGNRS